MTTIFIVDPSLPLWWTLGQDRRGGFGVRLVDEEPRGARKVERVSAAGVVGCDQGLDSRCGKSRLGKLCVASRWVSADLDHFRATPKETSLRMGLAQVSVEQL
ncbi:MAG TPA: hypothetical protein VH650_02665 [Gaiellaceae bacterium]|jgi:hypothetical protein